MGKEINIAKEQNFWEVVDLLSPTKANLFTSSEEVYLTSS